ADPAGIAADVDNLAAVALHHLWQKSLDQLHWTDEVEHHDLVPNVKGHLPERTDLAPAGAVDDDVDRAALSLDGCAEAGDRSVIGDIEVDVLGLMTLLLNRGSGGLAFVLGDIGYDD